MNDIMIIVVMIIGYSVPILILIWVYTIAFSFRRGAPYVPTDEEINKRAMKLLELENGDNLVDLGSGDGRFIFYAAKKYPRVQFTGVELSNILLLWSRFRQALGGYDNVVFLKEDILKHDISKYNKVYIYLSSDMNDQLGRKFIEEGEENLRVVSLAFDFGDKFVEKDRVDKFESDSKSISDTLYLWKKDKGKKGEIDEK